MTLENLLNQINSRHFDFKNVGSFRKKNVDNSCRFHHVVQRAFLGQQLLVGDVAWFYHKRIMDYSSQFRVLPICQVIMPTHIHEIYVSEDVTDISKMRAAACRSASVMMKKYQREKHYTVHEHLFNPEPGYVAIKDAKQLLITLKYIRDNDLYLKQEGSKAPYSCFRDWETRGFFKPYGITVLEGIFNMQSKELIELLMKDKEEVVQAAETYTNASVDLFIKQKPSDRKT